MKSDKIGNHKKKAILVVSFGTSYNDTRDKTIGAIEQTIALAFPDFDIKRAFTSRIIINKLKERDGLKIHDVAEAMDELAEQGYETVIIQPTHVIKGIEYDEMLRIIRPYQPCFSKLIFGEPLLSHKEDFLKVIDILIKHTESFNNSKTAIVLMGHGSEHEANGDYIRLEQYFRDMGYKNYIVGTVEADPSLETVISKAAETESNRVILQPFMIVAGDHVNNDMAGEGRDSWKTKFQTAGYEVICVMKGLGEFREIRDLFVQHIGYAINKTER